jgi:prepilin-type N-terminal cleavage/methylation domain-containing protein
MRNRMRLILPSQGGSRRRAHGFTLIELLVVIAIIAILAAILFPVFARAREQARKTTCASNMKQIATATLMYAQDYDELFPGSSQDTRLTQKSGPKGAVVNWGFDVTCAPINKPPADGTAACPYGALNTGGRRRGYTATWQGGGLAMIRPYTKTDGIFFCPNQARIDAVQSAGFENSYNLDFQWLGPMARVTYPSQKIMLIETYTTHDSDNFRRYCCDGPAAWDIMAMVDGHVKLMRLDRGCASPAVAATNPACASWYACNSASCCPQNYGCTGASGNAPDFP